MSVEVSPHSLEGAQKVFSADEMYRLGIEASTPGVGEITDLITAHQWFNLAAMQGNELAKEYRQQLTLEMSPRDIAEAQRRARQWLADFKPALRAV